MLYIHRSTTHNWNRHPIPPFKVADELVEIVGRLVGLGVTSFP